ncbi:MAG: hypothetical protein M3546_05725 [Actinomycetota bacterium]|nr:hypothetical protein [Actinomycetota bacterium]
MFGSTHTIRRLAGLAVAAGAFAALIPVAQAGSGFQSEHDAVDPVAQMQGARQAATFDGRESARLELSSLSQDIVARQQARQSATFDGRESARLTSPDVVERTAIALQVNGMPDLSGMPDVVERTAAAGAFQYLPEPTASSSALDWNDFGIGAGAGAGLILLLLGIGASVWITRQDEREVSSI